MRYLFMCVNSKCSLGDICNSIPPLPIKLDTSLLLPIAITGEQQDFIDTRG